MYIGKPERFIRKYLKRSKKNLSDDEIKKLVAGYHGIIKYPNIATHLNQHFGVKRMVELKSGEEFVMKIRTSQGKAIRWCKLLLATKDNAFVRSVMMQVKEGTLITPKQKKVMQRIDKQMYTIRKKRLLKDKRLKSKEQEAIQQEIDAWNPASAKASLGTNYLKETIRKNPRT